MVQNVEKLEPEDGSKTFGNVEIFDHRSIHICIGWRGKNITIGVTKRSHGIFHEGGCVKPFGDLRRVAAA